MKFFIDNNVSPTLTKAIDLLSARFGHEVWHLLERFEKGTDGLVWIEKLSDEGGWCVITPSSWIKAGFTTITGKSRGTSSDGGHAFSNTPKKRKTTELSKCRSTFPAGDVSTG
ncbi:hypothetical protein BPMI_02383 [Candidatus Burkholderia pumila]|uniref:VapC45 PIN like domain-containing protein n=1 Tax=Candidatus Burkholderia pumila TaxID=1090375 RepID=A0ABR5HLT2_9BURK|nr:hypothetical protein BPMI_02383 [Candidatus Burkholderia pumila]